MPPNLNLFDTYFDLVDFTEPPVIYHRWSLISCLGALLGRQAWINFGSFRIFPNQYVMLIGDPGARKSTAIKLAKKFLAEAGYGHFSAEKTTKEKFLLDLEGGEDEESDRRVSNNQVMETLFSVDLKEDCKEVFIVADEFNDFMRCGDLEFHSMLGALWDWDDENIHYKQRLKNSKSIAIFQPTISLLAGNTHTGFTEMFPPQAIGQGFLSRMLLIFSEPSGKKIAFPEPPNPKKKENLIQDLQAIKQTFKGEIEITRKAKEVLQVLYNTYQGFSDVRFTSYFTRRYTHLLKLSLICAATKQADKIDVEQILLANTILTYTEHFMPKALGEFGKAKNADVANRILSLLEKTLKPIEVKDIWKQVSSDLDRMEDLDKLLHGLMQANKIQWSKKTGGLEGGYLIVRKQLGNQALYVDFSLLKEYRQIGIG